MKRHFSIKYISTIVFKLTTGVGTATFGVTLRKAIACTPGSKFIFFRKSIIQKHGSERFFQKPYVKIYKFHRNVLLEKSLLAKAFRKINISDEIKNIRNVSSVRSSVAAYAKGVGYVGRLRESPNMPLDASLTLPVFCRCRRRSGETMLSPGTLLCLCRRRAAIEKLLSAGTILTSRSSRQQGEPS